MRVRACVWCCVCVCVWLRFLFSWLFRYQSTSMSVPWRQRCSTILTHHRNKPPILCSMSRNPSIEYGGECGALLIYGLRVYISPLLFMCVTLMTTYWAICIRHQSDGDGCWCSFNNLSVPRFQRTNINGAHKMYSLLMNWHYTVCITTAESEQERDIYNGKREKHQNTQDNLNNWNLFTHCYSNVWTRQACFQSCV